MKIRNRLAFRLLAGVAAMACSAVSANAATVTVSGNTDGWTVTDGVGWSHAFVNGPATPPAGTGSLNFKENTNDGSDAGQASLSSYDGRLLSDLTAFSYSTYVTTWNGQQAPWVRIYVDTDSNGSTDQYLSFEPDFQTSPSPAAATGVWQTWNTLSNNGWYADDGVVYVFGSPGDVTTGNLADYLSANPNARIATDHVGGSFRLRSGFTGPGDNFDTNIDNVTLAFGGASPSNITYDFEAAAVVPLPPSAWAGLALLGGLGITGFVRNRREQIASLA